MLTNPMDQDVKSPMIVPFEQVGIEYESRFMEIIGKTKLNPSDKLNYTDPDSEAILENCEVNFSEGGNQTNSLVVQDRTHLCLQKTYVREELENSIRIFSEEAYGRDETPYFQSTLAANPRRVEYFVQKGLLKDEAYCCALVLSFYTGKNAHESATREAINRRASRTVRLGNLLLNDEESRKFFPVMHYLVKALAHIPYYRNICKRAVKMKEKEILNYKVGYVINWIQFSSSTKTEIPSYFASRNVYFHLYSITGRDISMFSNFPTEEEILFSPFSTFLVTKKEEVDGKCNIYMRQIELGLSENVILWVDDNIFTDQYNNKETMEKLTTLGLCQNLHIVPKSSSETARAFLKSKFGQRLKCIKTFKIISDMKRPGKTVKDGNQAGALFLKEMRDNGFNHQCVLYTLDKDFAFNALKENGLDENVETINKQFRLIDYFQKCGPLYKNPFSVKEIHEFDQTNSDNLNISDTLDETEQVLYFSTFKISGKCSKPFSLVKEIHSFDHLNSANMNSVDPVNEEEKLL